MQFDTGAQAGGRYMIHCHNLVHEDHDMMVQFAVGDLPEQRPHHLRPAGARTRLPEGSFPPVYLPGFPAGT